METISAVRRRADGNQTVKTKMDSQSMRPRKSRVAADIWGITLFNYRDYTEKEGYPDFWILHYETGYSTFLSSALR